MSHRIDPNQILVGLLSKTLNGTLTEEDLQVLAPEQRELYQKSASMALNILKQNPKMSQAEFSEKMAVESGLSKSYHLIVSNQLKQVINDCPLSYTYNTFQTIRNACDEAETLKGIQCGNCFITLEEYAQKVAKISTLHIQKQIELVEKFKFCGNCLKISYCSVQCQKAHWKAGHKKECTPPPK
jgi:hypothetical protein